MREERAGMEGGEEEEEAEEQEECRRRGRRKGGGASVEGRMAVFYKLANGRKWSG